MILVIVSFVQLIFAFCSFLFSCVHSANNDNILSLLGREKIFLIADPNISLNSNIFEWSFDILGNVISIEVNIHEKQLADRRFPSLSSLELLVGQKKW